MKRGVYIYKVLGLVALLALVVACSEGSHHDVPRDGDHGVGSSDHL